MLTENDIPQYTGRNDWTDTVTLKDGYSVRVNVVRDEYFGEPWKECDGHGPVSDWRPRDSKRPGERVLHSDRNSCLFYDFAGAVALARRDGWGSKGDEGLTGGAKAAHAAEADFEYLRRWCNGEWYYVVVGVEVSRRSAVVGGVDYCGSKSAQSGGRCKAEGNNRACALGRAGCGDSMNTLLSAGPFGLQFLRDTRALSPFLRELQPVPRAVDPAPDTPLVWWHCKRLTGAPLPTDERRFFSLQYGKLHSFIQPIDQEV